MMTREEALESLDEASERLARAFAQRGSAALVIRVLDNGDVRLIGPELPPDTVCSLLHSAANIYADNAEAPRMN